jgi:hypothetical protein
MLVNLTILQKNLSYKNLQEKKVREKKKMYLRGALESAHFHHICICQTYDLNHM